MANANSVVQDQTAPEGAVRSESTLFVISLSFFKKQMHKSSCGHGTKAVKSKFRPKKCEIMLDILGHLPYNGRTIHVKSEIKIQMNFAILASLSNLIYFLFICFDTLRRNKLKNSIIKKQKKEQFFTIT